MTMLAKGLPPIQDHDAAQDGTRVRQNTWTCRYCGLCESAPMTDDTCLDRRMAHEYSCARRPLEDTPFEHERAAFHRTHARPLQIELLSLRKRRESCEDKIATTSYLRFLRRRSLAAELDRIQADMRTVYDKAAVLQLPCGWARDIFSGH